MAGAPPIHPRGTVVRLRYGHGRDPAGRFMFPFHNRDAVVVQPPWGPGKRNELVRLTTGELVNVPAGNLRIPVVARGELL